MATRITTLYTRLTDFTQIQEDSLAVTLVGKSFGHSVLFNTTLAKIRLWNGIIFENMPDILPEALPPLTKFTVGLNNVDNTSDLNKPVSIAQQNSLNLKENITPYLREISANNFI